MSSAVCIKARCKEGEHSKTEADTIEGEYVEEEVDIKEDKELIETEPTTTINTSTTTTSPSPAAESTLASDPLADFEITDTKRKTRQEQVHNILKPYYRTVDEPWSQEPTAEPRITLAAMFQTNSNKFRKDSLTQQCSRTNCQYRRHCYWEREWEQRQGKGLYHYTQCV